ncbi:EthD family reductase [Sabulicella rubraurantiaca]|uniref:EthD family reductase n=1 Tax=Sabulicella rubraurantiaca TaxID=2811429 RepID=UPI001A95E89C|nr:EthD family reductase [Sabulicella rubraurantiaca]
MIVVLVTVLYPNQEGSRFDHGYYMERHAALVRQRWEPIGLKDARFLRGIGTPDGRPAPYQVIALLNFSTADALQQAVAAHGAEIFSDIPRFTDVQPIVQVNEAL